MEHSNNHSIFPTRDTLEEVIDEAKAQLPITDEHTLVALMKIQENTLLAIQNKEQT